MLGLLEGIDTQWVLLRLALLLHHLALLLVDLAPFVEFITAHLGLVVPAKLFDVHPLQLWLGRLLFCYTT